MAALKERMGSVWPRLSKFQYTGGTTKSLKDFDADTKKTQDALAALKRTYTLKLFVGRRGLGAAGVAPAYSC